MALAITRMAPAGYDWKSDCQASRSRNVRVFKRHLEKRVNRYVQKGECDEPVEGKLKHFTKQYEKMHWVAAVTPQDYVDRLTNNFPVLVLEARKGLHVPRKAPLARVKMQQPVSDPLPLTPFPFEPVPPSLPYPYPAHPCRLPSRAPPG